MPKGTTGLEPAYVEFVFRVHADGRRERIATVYAQDQGGTVRPIRGKLNGEVGEFSAEAVAEVVELGLPRKTRQVPIDDRRLSVERGRHRRR